MQVFENKKMVERDDVIIIKPCSEIKTAAMGLPCDSTESSDFTINCRDEKKIRTLQYCKGITLVLFIM